MLQRTYVHGLTEAINQQWRAAAQAMADAGLGQLSEAAGELAEGLREGDKSKVCQSCNQLSKEVNKHAQPKKIDQMLCSQCQKLSECKGQCQGSRLSTAKNPKKSTSPSQKWGKGTSGIIDGERTKLDGQRKIEEITGTAGDGPSEFETSHAPEGKELAGSRYRECYQKYKKLSDAVLESEPIPLGHRQTIRRYFEMIRPQGNEPASAPIDDSPKN